MNSPTSFSELKNILVPVDLSPLSEAAVAAAKQILAEAPAAKLTLVMAVEPVFSIVAPVFMGDMATSSAQLNEAKATLQKYRDRVAPGADCQILEGAAWIEICKAAEKADMIVLSSHGRSGLARVWMGSVAENVLRHAPCSVLIAKPLSDKPSLHLDKIVVGVDYAAPKHPALAFADGICSTPGRSLFLVAAAPPITPVMLDMPYPTIPSEIDFISAVDEKLQQIKGGLKNATTCKARAGMGVPWRVLVDTARDESAGLIIVGEHSKAHGGAILGTTAELTVRHSPCAVLVVRDKTPAKS